MLRRRSRYRPTPGGFLEQLAPVVRAVGQQRVDHPGFDHDAGVGAEAGAAQQVVDVAQPAGGRDSGGSRSRPSGRDGA